LKEALKLAEKSSLVRGTLGEHIFAKFIANKREEIGEYAKNVGSEFDKQVSEYEISRYLPFL
jgi:glutamine synthetase